MYRSVDQKEFEQLKETAKKLNAVVVVSIEGDNNFEMVDVGVVGDYMSEAEITGQTLLNNSPQDVARWCRLVPLFGALFLRGSLAIFIRSGYPAQWGMTLKDVQVSINTALKKAGLTPEKLQEVSMESLALMAGSEILQAEERMLLREGSEEKRIFVVQKGADEVFRKISEFFIDEKGGVRT